MSISGSVTVINEGGIHARPSAEISEKASKYKSKIIISYNGKMVDARDTLQIMILGLFKNDTVHLSADGEDQEDAFCAIKELLEKIYAFD